MRQAQENSSKPDQDKVTSGKLLLTFIFFLIGAGFVYTSIFDVDATSPIAAQITALGSPARTIASEVNLDSRHADLNLELGCSKAVTTFTSQRRLIQFKGKICQTHQKKLEKVQSISNLTNKVTASVFQLDPTHFETDIMSLSKGSNEFEVISNQGSGPTKTKIIVNLK